MDGSSIGAILILIGIAIVIMLGIYHDRRVRSGERSSILEQLEQEAHEDKEGRTL